jgi:hypothetical protein
MDSRPVKNIAESFWVSSYYIAMEIWHRGHIAVEHKGFLEANRIKHEHRFSVKHPSQIRDYIFEISEDHLAFREIMGRLAREYTYVTTFFTDDERLKADYCIIRTDCSILSSLDKANADSYYTFKAPYFSGFCSKCGTGWSQIAPFQLKREPKIGRNQFCGFGSGFELFCTSLVLGEFSSCKIGGFETWPLILEEGHEPIESLKQIMVTEVAEPAIAEDLVEHERYCQTDCPVCGQTWHAHYIRGMLPLRRTALKPNVDFQLTNEWFGNGRTARREMLISQRVVRLILENKWKGAELVPIQAV